MSMSIPQFQNVTTYRQGKIPELNQESSTDVGSTIYTEFDYQEIETIRLTESVKWNMMPLHFSWRCKVCKGESVENTFETVWPLPSRNVAEYGETTCDAVHPLHPMERTFVSKQATGQADRVWQDLEHGALRSLATYRPGGWNTDRE